MHSLTAGAYAYDGIDAYDEIFAYDPESGLPSRNSPVDEFGAP